MANTFNHNDKVVITDGGSVGIGTASPIEKLDVAGNLKVGGTATYNTVSVYNNSAAGGGGFLAYQNGVVQAFLGAAGWYTGTTDTGLVVGTDSSSRPIRFYTSTERMRITGDGNVGIGKTNPTYTLDVSGSLRTTGSITVDSGNQITLDQNYAVHAYLQFSGDSFGTESGFGMYGYYGIAFHTRQGNGITLRGDSNNVGINTTSPAARLDVAGAVKITGGSWPTAGTGVELNYSGNTSYIGSYDRTNSLYKPLFFFASEIKFETSATERMIITSAGNVGIGTTSPGYTFTVQKSITNDWIGQINNTYNGSGNGILIDAGDGTNGEILRLRDKDGNSKVSFLSNGNVGIGTTSPDNKLTVKGDNALVDVQSTADGQTVGFLARYLNNSTLGGAFRYTTGDAQLYIDNLFNGNNGLYSDINIRNCDTGGTIQNRIKIKGSTGYVGIGTTSPGALLDVAGNIKTSTQLRIERAPSNSVSSGPNIYFIGGTGASYSQIQQGIDKLDFWGFDGASWDINMSIDNSNRRVGIGLTSPSAYLDIKGAADTDGLVALQTRAGNSSNNYESNQIAFGYGNQADYRHAIKTRHHSNNYLNAIDFYVWKYGTDEVGTIGTQHVMTLIQGGSGSAGDGRVGIGTTSPSYPLEVVGVGGIAALRSTSATGQTYLDFVNSSGTPKGYVGYGASSNDTLYLTQLVSGADIGFYNGGSIRMAIKSTGNVGIGTTSPNRKLTVSGNGTLFALQSDTVAGYSEIELTANGVGAAYVFKSSAGKTDYGGAGAMNYYNTGSHAFHSNSVNNILHLTAAGNVGIGTTSPAQKLSVLGNIYQRTGDYITWNNGDAQIGAVSGYNLAFSVYDGSSSMVERMRITSGGNVGIGTNAPDEKLHVGGNLKVVGSIYAEPSITINGNTDDTKQLLFKTGNIERWNFYTDGAEPGSEVGSDLKLARYYDNGASIEDMLFLKRTNGYFGIGGNPSERLSVSGNIYIASGSLGVNVTPNATDGRIDASNDIVAYQTSDKRLKENITPIENALDKVKSLTGVEFDWIEETKHVHGYEGHDVGIIAQDVQAVLPTAVRTNQTGYLSVRYEKMIALLVEAMKEQQTQIDELKAKLDGFTK
jgi:hypothetical protein